MKILNTFLGSGCNCLSLSERHSVVFDSLQFEEVILASMVVAKK